MDSGLVQIILAVIALLGTVLTAIVAPYIRAKYSAEKRAEAYEYVTIAVRAAEQVLKAVDPYGDKRKAYVLTFMEQIGVKVTEDELDIMIEAAVKELNIIVNEALE
jgi:type II secretory pathway pseudopilin PulG